MQIGRAVQNDFAEGCAGRERAAAADDERAADRAVAGEHGVGGDVETVGEGMEVRRAAAHLVGGGAAAVADAEDRAVGHGGRAGVQVAVVESERARRTIGDQQPVGGDDAAVEHGGAAPRIQYGVAGGVGHGERAAAHAQQVARPTVFTDIKVGRLHCAAIGDEQRIERAKLTDAEKPGVGPR